MGGGAAFFQKLKSLSQEDRAQLKSASPEERNALLHKAGLTDSEIEQMDQMRRNFGGGGGGGGGRFGGGGGPPGGGEGGP